MTYKIEFLPTAYEDLKQIEDWCAIRFGIDTAIEATMKILDTIQRLEEFPESGSLTPDQWLDEKGYRMLICSKCVVIYKRIHDSVFIYHIADTRSKYTRLFYK